MTKITFLGPVGATFSHDAYNILADIYVAPKFIDYAPAITNGEILKMVGKHGGYGAIAMETLAEGRVAEPLESFIELLKDYNAQTIPFHVIGAIQLKLHFCLMAQKGQTKESLRERNAKIVAHPKALGACKDHIAQTGLPTEGVNSNGEAARLVAEDSNYATYAALGPQSAAGKYSLSVLDSTFEDRDAVTTFFLIGPKTHTTVVGEDNRVLIVFELPHTSGSLVKALHPFEEEKLNLIQIHSVHRSNRTYDFAIEIEVKKSKGELEAFDRALEKFIKVTQRYICFGPFTVQER